MFNIPNPITKRCSHASFYTESEAILAAQKLLHEQSISSLDLSWVHEFLQGDELNETEAPVLDSVPTVAEVDAVPGAEVDAVPGGVPGGVQGASGLCDGRLFEEQVLAAAVPGGVQGASGLCKGARKRKPKDRNFPKSKYKHVFWSKNQHKWNVWVKHPVTKKQSCASFVDEVDAAKAADQFLYEMYFSDNALKNYLHFNFFQFLE